MLIFLSEVSLEYFKFVLDGCCSYQVNSYLANGQAVGLSPIQYEMKLCDLDKRRRTMDLVYIKVGEGAV